MQFENINPLTPGTFLPKTRFLDILDVLRLDLSRSSFNLVENASGTQQLALLATRIMFYDLLKTKFWTRRRPMSLGFSIFEFFLPLPFFSFSFLFAAVINLLLGLLAIKKLLRKSH